MESHENPLKINIRDNRFEVFFDSKLVKKYFKEFCINLLNEDTGSAIYSLKKTLFHNKETLEYKAFDLIYRSILKSYIDIINEAGFSTEKISEIIKNDFYYKTAGGLYYLDRDFFVNPSEHDLTSIAKNNLTHILIHDFNLDSERANRLSAQFSSFYLVKNLTRIWDNELHGELFSFFSENPYGDVLNKKYKISAENRKLCDLFDQPCPMAGERKLQNIYVEPHFWIYDDCIVSDDDKLKRTFTEINHFPNFKEHADKYKLLDYSIGWILQDQSNLFGFPCEKSSVLLLLGHPGQGKTAFLYFLISRFYNKTLGLGIGFDWRIIYFNIETLADVEKFLSDPLRNIIEIKLGTSLNELDEKNLLLIDGLEEINKWGVDAISVIEKIYKSIELYKQNVVKVIVGCRSNYIEYSKHNTILTLHIADYTEEQKLKYLRNIGSRLIENEIVDNYKIDITTSILRLGFSPASLYLLSEIKDIDLKISVKNEFYLYVKLYENYLNFYFDRKWSNSGQIFRFKIFTKQNLRLFFQKIALGLYQKTSIFDLFDLCNLMIEHGEGQNDKVFLDKSITKKILKDDEKIENVIIDLTSLGFVTINRRALESYGQSQMGFIDKKFQEYLIADYFWNRVCEIDFNSHFEDKFIDLLYEFTQPNMLSYSVCKFLHVLIDNAEGTLINAKLSKLKLSKLFKEMLCSDFDILKNDKKYDNLSLFETTLSVFYGFWILLMAIIKPMIDKEKNYKEYSVIEDEYGFLSISDRHRFARYLLLISQKNNDIDNDSNQIDYESNGKDAQTGRENKITLSLIFQNLSSQKLLGLNFENSDFTGVNFERTILRSSILKTVNFQKANLKNTDFSYSDLSGSDFSGADLSSAKFCFAKLTGAIFNNADIFKADFTNATFVDIEPASQGDIEESDYYKMICTAKNYQYATFKGTVFRSIIRTKKKSRR